MNAFSEGKMRESDKWIPWFFVAFFVVIALVNGIFIYFAITSFTGVVTDHAYEKGLAYNEMLDKARQQGQLHLIQKASYEADTLRWRLADKNNEPLVNAKVSAHIMRPSRVGFDFDIVLVHQGGGVYEAPVNLPLMGRWRAELEAQWKAQTYQITHDFTVPLRIVAP